MALLSRDPFDVPVRCMDAKGLSRVTLGTLAVLWPFLCIWWAGGCRICASISRNLCGPLWVSRSLLFFSWVVFHEFFWVFSRGYEHQTGPFCLLIWPLQMNQRREKLSFFYQSLWDKEFGIRWLGSSTWRWWNAGQWIEKPIHQPNFYSI